MDQAHETTRVSAAAGLQTAELRFFTYKIPQVITSSHPFFGRVWERHRCYIDVTAVRAFVVRKKAGGKTG